jgi:glycosyltransferase involved in cell wall biosynthesis
VEGNKRLKILFLPGWYPNEANPIEGIFVKEQAKAASLYNDVMVIYNDRKTTERIQGLRLYRIVSDKKEDGIRTIRIKHRKSFVRRTSRLIYLYSVWRIFISLIKGGWKPDIIHVHVYSAGTPAVVLGRKYKIPIAVTEHWTGFLRHTLNKRDMSKALSIMNKANIILPVSRELELAIKAYGIRNKFEVVPNVVNTRIFYPSDDQGNNPQKTILSVTALSYLKGITFLFESLSQLKQKREDFILNIIGDGPDREEYKKLAEELQISKMVKFHGRKTKEEIAEFMRNCDFFVQPSLCETFGVVYIEAMACGKPIVATQLPVLQEKINEERGILVPPKDVYALTKAINYMIDHYQDYSAEKISRYASDNFGYEVIGKRLDSIYKNILKPL